MTKPKRPKDTNQLAHLIAGIATGEIQEFTDLGSESGKNPAAVELGRKGGLVGGKARAKALTPEKRQEIAKKAASTRWRK